MGFVEKKDREEKGWDLAQKRKKKKNAVKEVTEEFFSLCISQQLNAGMYVNSIKNGFFIFFSFSPCSYLAPL